MTPTVSVLMSTFNGARLVEETIATVLGQTFADWELVIVDDASTDDTLDVLRRHTDRRIVVIPSERNGGPVAARNLAMATTRGRYIAGLDQDDLCEPDRFARQVTYLDAHANTVLVAGIAAQLKDGRRWLPGLPRTTPDFLDWALLIENQIAWSSTMFRGDAARALDPFERPDMIYAEDFELYHRLRKFGRIARIDAPLITYRIHGGSISRRYQTIMHTNVARLLAEAHAPILGPAAAESSGLALRYATTAAPAPDAATIAHAIDVIGALRRHILARGIDAKSRRLIDAEYARYWRTMVRQAVRAGTVTLAEALATRPVDLPARHAASPGVLLSPVIGHVRARRAGVPHPAAQT